MLIASNSIGIAALVLVGTFIASLHAFNKHILSARKKPLLFLLFFLGAVASGELLSRQLGLWIAYAICIFNRTDAACKSAAIIVLPISFCVGVGIYFLFWIKSKGASNEQRSEQLGSGTKVVAGEHDSTRGSQDRPPGNS